MNVIHLVTADETALLQVYRRSCADHQENIRLFADTAATRCAQHQHLEIGADVIPLQRAEVIPLLCRKPLSRLRRANRRARAVVIPLRR